MDWVVLEQVDDAGVRLVALRLADGERRVLYATEQQSPLRASVHPKAERVAVDVQSRGRVRGRTRTRVGLVNLKRRGVGWLKQSLDPKWRIARAVFDDTGTRLALEGAYDGAALTDIYVLELTLSGNSVRDKIIAGAGNETRLSCGRPLFTDGGKQVLYLRNTRPEGAWEISVMELARPGDSATLLEGRAPSVLALTLTDGANAVPDVDLAYCGAIKQVFWAGFARGGSRQQLRTARLGVRPHTDLGRSHQRIEEVAVSSGGELVACSADARLWLTETETGATVPLLDGVLGASHRGLAFDEANKRLIFCTNDSDGARLRAVDLVTRSVTTLCGLGDVTVLGLHALAPEAEISKRMEQFQSVVDESAPAADATAIQRIRPASDSDILPAASVEMPPEALGSESSDELHTSAPPPDDAAAEDEPADSGDDTAVITGDVALAVAEQVMASTDDMEPETAEIPQAALDALHAADAPAEDAADTPAEDVADTPAPDAVDEPTLAEPNPAEAPIAAPAAEPTPPDADDEQGSMDISTSFAVETTPTEALAGWLKQVAALDDPTESLESFEGARDDLVIREAARMHLGTQRRRAMGLAEAPPSLLMAITVAGHLHLTEARNELNALCRSARERVDQNALPEAEEHFALSALLYMDGHSTRFGWATIHQDYLNMFERISDVLEDEGEGPAARMMAAICEGYARQLDGVLAVETHDAVKAFDPAHYRAQSLANMAAQATEAAEQQRAEAEAAAQAAAEAEAARLAEAAAQAAAEAEAARLAEAERIAAEAAEAQRLAMEAEQRRLAEEAARRAAEEAERQRLAEEAEQRRLAAEAAERQRLAMEAEQRRLAEEAARRAAEEAARAKAEEERIWAERRRVAEEEARLRAEAEARAKAEEERIWAERRRAAEAADREARAQQVAEQQAADEAAQRAAAAAAAKIEAAEQARREAEAAVAAAEVAARLQAGSPEPAAPSAPQVQAPQPTFNPLGEPGNRSTAQPRAVQPAAEPASQFAPDNPMGWSAEDSIDMPAVASSKAPPPIMPIGGLFGAASGIALLVLGLKLSIVMQVLGIAWVVGGVGLFSDRRGGWMAALGTFAVNAIYLVALGLGTLPEWMPAALPVLWGLASAGMFAALLHPSIRARFGPKRRKF